MLIREYHESDLHALRAIHAAQGFDYALPDLSNPLFVTKLVLSDANVAPPGACPGEVGTAASLPLEEASALRDAGLKPGATQGKILGAAEIPSTGREGNRRILGAALLSQYWGGLAPCELCLLQRWPWLAAITIALVALLVGSRPALPWVALGLGLYVQDRYAVGGPVVRYLGMQKVFLADISPAVVTWPSLIRQSRKGPVMSPYLSNCTGPITPT